MVQVWPLFLHVSPKRCGLRDGGWLTTTANFPSDITPGAIAERLDYLIWVYFVESTNANLLLLVSSPARPTYLVAGRNTWAQNISRVLSQGLGVFQHSGILANLFSAWASYMHMDMYIEIQSHICVCVFSARAQELPSGLWEEDLQDPFQTCQHEGPPGSDWWVLWRNWWTNPFLHLRMGRPLEWCRHGLLSSMATSQQTPQPRILEGSFPIWTLKFDPSCLGVPIFQFGWECQPKEGEC